MMELYYKGVSWLREKTVQNCYWGEIVDKSWVKDSERYVGGIKEKMMTLKLNKMWIC
jgi:hypothetical protein